VAEGVAQALQDRYERILRGRAPLALYAVRAGACGHCFTAVPLYRLQKLEWVRGAKEASTLMAELDLARTVLAREEAEWVKSADRVQDAKGYVEECEEVVQELKTGQAPKREELAARLAELDDRLKAAQADRAKVAEGVAQALQDRYERILRGRAPLALYAVRAGACGHCFTAVPLYRLQKLRNGDTLETCEACGVLLYDEGE